MKQYFKKLIIIPVMLSFLCLSSPVSLVSETCECVHKTENTKVINLSGIRKKSLITICHICFHILDECICNPEKLH